MRNGFGTYSIPTEDGGYTKQYSGGWKDNKKHVCVVIVCLSVCLSVCGSPIHPSVYAFASVDVLKESPCP